MTSSWALTPRQKEVLDYIRSFMETKGYAPSQQEIAAHFGFKSLGTVQDYLVRLENAGALSRKGWNTRRGVQVQPSDPPSYNDAVASLPLLGRVAAGRPIESLENDRSFEVPTSLLIGASGRRMGQGQWQDFYLLRVAGDSMIDEGILDGDLAVIRRQRNAVNGQTVVALIGSEATIKKYYRKGERIELHPANPRYQPIVLTAENASEGGATPLRIEGVLVSLIRRYGDEGGGVP